MCRFLVYKGREMLMADLLTRSAQSLIFQSFNARERTEPLNGDGFGVGWYAPEIDPTPCVFTSLQPAWSNRNLARLAEKIRSTCFFAHVRAASPGQVVSEFNCHPFQVDGFLWMHNGCVADFGKIKRRLRQSLDDGAYDAIQGTTDSEHAFAVFLNELKDRLDDYTVDDMQQAIRNTIRKLHAWSADASVTAPSQHNFAVTDGQSIIVTRYETSGEGEPPSLYLSLGERFERREGGYRMVPTAGRPRTVIVASEPLTAERSDWEKVPPNHLVVVTPELHVRLNPID